MELITWNDEYKLGLVVIDYQHKKLVMLINNLSQSILGGKTKESITEIFEGLEEYIKNHFKTEEMFFKEFNYKDTEEHINEHKVFIEQITQAKKAYESGKGDIQEELLRFLKMVD